MQQDLKTIDFSTNWNNKLANRAFTTIRLKNTAKYKIGEMYSITLNKKPLATRKILDIRTFVLSELNEWICRIDTGYSLPQTIEMMKKMYPQLIERTTPFYLILLA